MKYILCWTFESVVFLKVRFYCSCAVLMCAVQGYEFDIQLFK